MIYECELCQTYMEVCWLDESETIIINKDGLVDGSVFTHIFVSFSNCIFILFFCLFLGNVPFTLINFMCKIEIKCKTFYDSGPVWSILTLRCFCEMFNVILILNSSLSSLKTIMSFFFMEPIK